MPPSLKNLWKMWIRQWPASLKSPMRIWLISFKLQLKATVTDALKIIRALISTRSKQYLAICIYFTYILSPSEFLIYYANIHRVKQRRYEKTRKRKV